MQEAFLAARGAPQSPHPDSACRNLPRMGKLRHQEAARLAPPCPGGGEPGSPAGPRSAPHHEPPAPAKREQGAPFSGNKPWWMSCSRSRSKSVAALEVGAETLKSRLLQANPILKQLCPTKQDNRHQAPGTQKELRVPCRQGIPRAAAAGGLPLVHAGARG